MNLLNSFGTSFPSLCFCVMLGYASFLPVDARPAATEKLHAITDSGKPIASIFEGRQPSDYVRQVLVLRRPMAARTRTWSAGPDQGGLAQMFKRFLVPTRPTYLACPTGGICAQPGTTSSPGQFCEDPSGCGVDTSNQINTPNMNLGTMELYDCEQCCVDWAYCTIDTTNCDAVPLQGGSDPIIVLCGPSPIIIDTEGEGFHFTSAAAGVTFDISGSGHPIQIGWTDAHFHNGFLALPGPDGLVHNGRELFGDFTPQPSSPHPNGFLALEQYDKPENGGNGDGIIDERDQVFSRLRLWIDENHDGICQPNELHRLSELGVYSLALKYTDSQRTDQYGNQLRYRAGVNPGERRDPRDKTASGDPGRWTYDVFFVTK